ncbi:putative cysteine-rich repeat secretory protein 21 [Cocos nucifera]|uniref:Putative cysteine-rich repeat secretory protein 21 n=1 Tax=Cocos nucifera TaxID=13894 RepID=A0A8K0MXU6_COCNU|nr:putative cysteine-rich repeat secretory protein 21 [Cocos nucifera]
MFLSLPSSSSLFLLCLLFLLLHLPPIAADDPLYFICSNDNYTANSTYETNLDILLPTLVSNASLSRGFSSSSISQKPNEAYGLALCRGDVNISLCLSCLSTASHDIVRRCPNKIEAVIWYDHCLLRYSNQRSLATTEESQEFIMWNANAVTTDGPLFEKLVNELLTTIADWAAYNTTRKFAAGEVKFTTDFPMIYGLVQCIPDLGAGRCQQCLQEIMELIPEWLGSKRGGRVLRVQCNFRFEVYKFYYGAPMRKLGSPTPANPARKKGKQDHSLLESVELGLMITV